MDTRPQAGNLNYVALEADLVLKDGSTVHVRPVRPGDREALLNFYGTTSSSSSILRFPAALESGSLEDQVSKFLQIDFANAFGMVCSAGLQGKVVGHGMYRVVSDSHAEVAVNVLEDYRDRGIGTLLLGYLAQFAASKGVSAFQAWLLPSQHDVLPLLRDSGFAIEMAAYDGRIRATFSTHISDEGRRRFEDRERIGAAKAVASLLRPASIAVIGASRYRGTVGGELFHNLLVSGFPGPVYPVNPNTSTVQSIPAYPTVEAIPADVELAVIAVPSQHVASVAEQCARKGVKVLLVISSGFSEVGEEGRARQARLLEICRASGMRLVGPNCLGVINTSENGPLNATFAPEPPLQGNMGFASQSGALGLALVDSVRTLGLGLSSFVSLGNKADISGNDLLSYWESDPETRVILLYLESLGNPRKFSRIARNVARTKPIVVVKSGRSIAGKRAAASHTGALLQASDITTDTLFRQAGLIRTDTIPEMFDVATILGGQPLPRGPRVGIITNAGGPGILCADACEMQGLQIPLLSEETRQELATFLPGYAGISNPVDMTATAGGEQYEKAVQVIANDPEVDSLIVIYTHVMGTNPSQIAASLAKSFRQADVEKPLLAVFISHQDAPKELIDSRIPSYRFPEPAAAALARVVQYSLWRYCPLGEPVRFSDTRRDEAAAIVASALSRGGGWLSPEEASTLLSCYGLPMVEQELAGTPQHAARAADRLGGKVALKAVAPGLIHKSDVGAVRLGLEGGQEVLQTAKEMVSRLERKGLRPSHFQVQRMAADGVEMFAGAAQDPQFGPTLACGVGGTLVELLGDVSIRLTPLSSEDVRDMVRSLKTYPLLTGYRGQPALDVGALKDALLRLSALVEDRPEIAEIDLNPLIVHQREISVVDAKIRVSIPTPLLPLGAKA